MSKKLLAAAVCSVAMLAGTSASAADKTVNRYFDLVNNASSYNYSVNLPMKFVMPSAEKGGKNFQLDYNIKMNGTVVDQNKVGKEKQDLHVTYELKSPAFKEMLLTDKLVFSPDFKSNGNDLYVKINRLPAILSVVADTSAIENEWVKITQKDIENLLRQMAAGEDEAAKKEMETSIKQIQLSMDPKKQMEMRKQYMNLLKKNNFILAGKKLGDVKLAGTVAEKWQLKLNKDELSKLAVAFIEMADKNQPAAQKMTKEEKDQMNKDLKSFMKKVVLSGGEMAIAKNNQATSLKVSGKVVDLDDDKTTNDYLSVSMNMDTKDMNSKKLKVELPKKFLTLDEAVKLVKMNIDLSDSGKSDVDVEGNF